MDGESFCAAIKSLFQNIYFFLAKRLIWNKNEAVNFTEAGNTGKSFILFLLVI